MQVEQRGIGSRFEAGAFLRQSLGPGGIGGQAGGAADMRGVVVVDLLSEQKVGVGIAGDLCMSEEGDEPVLKITEATLDFSFGLGVGSDPMGNSQGGERALELRAGIQAVTGGDVAEEAQSIGVKGGGQAVGEEDGAQEAEVIPSGVGWDENTAEDFAGMIVDGENEALHFLGLPPTVRRGIMLEEFADGSALPAAPRFGAPLGNGDQLRKMKPDGVGDRRPRAREAEAPRHLIGQESEIRRMRVRKEVAQEVEHMHWPELGTRAAGGFGAELSAGPQPLCPQVIKLRAAYLQAFGGCLSIHVTGIEGGENGFE